ncbi:hypothetical protein I4U23_015997 [Adineta vaga]|nr:hypothetical protein I4U23_015997 [Adineta vaga]
MFFTKRFKPSECECGYTIANRMQTNGRAGIAIETLDVLMIVPFFDCRCACCITTLWQFNCTPVNQPIIDVADCSSCTRPSCINKYPTGFDDSKLKVLLINGNENLYAFISSIFSNLSDFTFTCHGFWRRYAHLTIDESCQTNSFLQNIVNLSIDVDTLDDCLHLLYGRLIYLRKFIVRIYKIQSAIFAIENKVLHNLRCFSLTSSKTTSEYDNSILPLLQRMISLEILTLCLSIDRTSTVIEGFHFKNQIFFYMPQLQRFNFEIKTSLRSDEQTNDELQKSFNDRKYGQVISYIEYDLYGCVQSHSFSLPYTINETLYFSSHFPGGLIPNVRSLTLMDMDCPFEHQFFPYLT